MAAINTRSEGPTITSDLSLLTESALDKAVLRAWREASRCWAEYRAEPSSSPVKRLLLTSAEAAEDWWQTLLEEQEARLTGDAVEVSSADVYQPIVESPFVKRAKAAELPAKAVR